MVVKNFRVEYRTCKYSQWELHSQFNTYDDAEKAIELASLIEKSNTNSSSAYRIVTEYPTTWE